MTPAKLSQLSHGDIVIADDGFTCLHKGDKRHVYGSHAEGLYILCAEGRHFLDGQLMSDTDDTLSGLFVEEVA